MALDQIFSTAHLNVLVPDTSLEFPPNTSVDKWLAAAQVGGVERRHWTGLLWSDTPVH
jgi:hypothetical protein